MSPTIGAIVGTPGLGSSWTLQGTGSTIGCREDRGVGSLTLAAGQHLLHFSTPGEKKPCHSPPGASHHWQAVVRNSGFDIPALEFPTGRKNGFAQLQGKAPLRRAGQRDIHVSVLQCRKGPAALSCPLERKAWTHVLCLGLSSVNTLEKFFLIFCLFSFSFFFFCLNRSETLLGTWPNHCRTTRVCFLYGDGKHCAGMQRYTFNFLLFKRKKKCV